HISQNPRTLPGGCDLLGDLLCLTSHNHRLLSPAGPTQGTSHISQGLSTVIGVIYSLSDSLRLLDPTSPSHGPNATPGGCDPLGNLLRLLDPVGPSQRSGHIN
ncbi:hypothetical protein, partial [Actinomyces slackii]